MLCMWTFFLDSLNGDLRRADVFPVVASLCPLNMEASRRRGSIKIDRRLNSNKSCNNYKLQSIYYYAYLNRSLMHPHGDHSYAHPMDDVDNSQWKFHSPDTEHRPAKSFHFLDQTVHCVEHWQQWDTQVDDRLLAHLLYPSHRHKPFPRNHCNRSLLCPLQAQFLQSVSNSMVYKLETIHIIFGLETNINLFDCVANA